MRYEINSGQKHFFEKEGFIEFDSFLNENEATRLKEVLEMSADPTIRNPLVKTTLPLSRIGQIAAPLFGTKFVRIAFMKYIPIYEITGSIRDISSITELSGGVFINLEPVESDLPLIPKTLGSATFFKPHVTIEFPELNLPLLLIVFADEKARYKFQENDPKTHELKKMGYGFGDRLTIETHPFIYKK